MKLWQFHTQPGPARMSLTCIPTAGLSQAGRVGSMWEGLQAPGELGRLMLFLFLIDTGDNCLRLRYFPTRKDSCIVPLPNGTPRVSGTLCLLCGGSVTTFWWEKDASSAVFSPSPCLPDLSHLVKIQRCPIRILSTGQFRTTWTSQEIRSSRKHAS